MTQASMTQAGMTQASMTQVGGAIFSKQEYEARLARAQSLLEKHELDGLLVTTPAELFYFTGFLTRFWESPTRPWFLIIPQAGKPIAVIPSIGEPLMTRCGVEDIRCWSSPDLSDDGISLLASTISEVIGGGKLAIPDGHETHVRMPLANLERLKNEISATQLVSDENIIRQLRMVKSSSEIEKIRASCGIANSAFARVSEIARAGAALDEIFRKFQMLCLEEGADWVPYLAGAAGPHGYFDVISPATATPLVNGDILMLDTGLVREGYFCDFDRNFAIGKPSKPMQEAHNQLIEATRAGFEMAKPGTTASDLFHAMNAIVSKPNEDTGAGRLGHGLGLSLTEWPSLIPTDHMPLQEGMVLTLEPGIVTRDGNMLVHEENIVITATGAQYLSDPAAPELTIVG